MCWLKWTHGDYQVLVRLFTLVLKSRIVCVPLLTWCISWDFSSEHPGGPAASNSLRIGPRSKDLCCSQASTRAFTTYVFNNICLKKQRKNKEPPIVDQFACLNTCGTSWFIVEHPSRVCQGTICTGWLDTYDLLSLGCFAFFHQQCYFK